MPWLYIGRCLSSFCWLQMNLLEPFIAFRRVLLQILGCNECTVQSTLRKGSSFSQSSAVLHEFKLASAGTGEQYSTLYWLAGLFRIQLNGKQKSLNLLRLLLFFSILVVKSCCCCT